MVDRSGHDTEADQAKPIVRVPPSLNRLAFALQRRTDMTILEWIDKNEKQTFMIIPETLVEYIDKNFDRAIADKIIVALVRSALLGECVDGYDLYNDSEQIVLDLLYEKVAVFGEPLHSKDGEKNV
jgi:hypothetical protein